MPIVDVEHIQINKDQPALVAIISEDMKDFNQLFKSNTLFGCCIHKGGSNLTWSAGSKKFKYEVPFMF